MMMAVRLSQSLVQRPSRRPSQPLVQRPSRRRRRPPLSFQPSLNLRRLPGRNR
ncbi:MAG: hypothetical protein LBT11_02185 [Treponema sp.]|nr:hypothetical protein [Treponema sp.]